MKMLRIAKGVTKLDKLRSEDIRKSMEIKESIAEKVEERQLKWFGHVKRRETDENYIVAEVLNLNTAGSPPRRRGRPKNSWYRQMQSKLNTLNIRDEIVNDRGRYRLRVHTRRLNERQPQV